MGNNRVLFLSFALGCTGELIMETDKYGYGHAECEKLCSVQGRDVQWAIREESGVQ